MNNFEYYNPVRIIFGAGELVKVGEEAKKLGQTACLVSYKDPGALQPVLDRIRELLEKAGLQVVTFYQIEPNPEIRTIGKGVDLCKDQNVDVMIGIGGGSAMDAAKAIAAGVFYKDDLWKMVCSRHDQAVAISPTQALPTLMIPTLPATGSEMNQCSVLSNAELGEKSYIWGTCLYPKVSIIDPELTLTLPPFQTACAAADSISHVLEIYLNGEEDSDLQHTFQEGVMRTVIKNAKKVLVEPDNISVRSHLQWAATCAINGWASPGDAWTPIHQVGHVLTARHGVPHGASLAILMPAWMRYMSAKRPAPYIRFATNVMEISPKGKEKDTLIAEGINAFQEFLQQIGVPQTLRERGITADHLPDICDQVIRISFGQDGMLACNPPVNREDIVEILRLAY